ncbi:hypothetical protein [Micromonospora endophytica]|uniref:Uncharacterized protein n=1 Tax=Micromonospora endophytica TaxID=515350 RepID=A0A2W2CU54_9ACTN|nr:hypothetical protein [Micromonospora endophytica]PZF91567.1 hypothetical protein C1I93_21325 [Micromonospora endophytica]RIW48488.1 hypothetical protein D3H59_06750 [Micromonospora endophytica]BCJ61185.1 hypothetical protein Jiend_46070 [Micromonospora endophytica]
MRVGDLLRQLDQLLLPRLAAALTRLGQAPFHGALLRWTAVLSCTAVLSTAVLATERPLAPELTIGEVTRVGVIDGDSISRYERAAARDLAALEGDGTPGDGTYALVSLTEYLTPQSLAEVVGDVRVAAVVSRVPLPERQTEIVRIPAQRLPEDVLTGMTDLAERREREAADYRSRAAALGGGGPQERELRQLYEIGARTAIQEATAYRAGCACVYAVVVRAPTTTLRGVAARPGVRVVDPAPEVRRLEGTVFTPPLPEQRDVVRPPVDRDLTPTPTPTPTPSVAPGSPSPDPVPEERVPGEPEVTDSSPAPAVTAPAPPPSATLTPSTSTDTAATSAPNPTP